MYVCNGISHYKTRTLDHTFLASNKLITVSNPTENTYSMWLKYSRLADGSGFIVLLPGRQFAGHTENYKAQINRCYTCHWWDNSHVLCILHCDMRYERFGTNYEGSTKLEALIMVTMRCHPKVCTCCLHLWVQFFHHNDRGCSK